MAKDSYCTVLRRLASRDLLWFVGGDWHARVRWEKDRAVRVSLAIALTRVVHRENLEKRSEPRDRLACLWVMRAFNFTSGRTSGSFSGVSAVRLTIGVSVVGCLA